MEFVFRCAKALPLEALARDLQQDITPWKRSHRYIGKMSQLIEECTDLL